MICYAVGKPVTFRATMIDGEDHKLDQLKSENEQLTESLQKILDEYLLHQI